MSNEYKDNTEPKVGDLVRLKSKDTVYRVESVQGGRCGNKVGVRPLNDPTGYCREYYYHCFIKV